VTDLRGLEEFYVQRRSRLLAKIVAVLNPPAEAASVVVGG
jgi:hypothetical protein